MSIVIWVIVVHLIEVALIGGYLLIRKNNQLEKVIADQQQYIDAITVIINDSSETIKQLDNRGAFEADDEVGTFFRNLKEIQTILDQFNLRKN
jgi:Na+-transporting NADH:ubiquinone oxidoreductase subunit NqrC